MAESTRQRLAFDLYWGLGSRRSIERLRRDMFEQREDLGLAAVPSLRTLYNWSSRYHWQDRIGDLEAEAVMRSREDKIAQLREMGERQGQVGLAMLHKGLAKFQASELGEMTVADAIRALVEGSKLERLARGEPTEIEQVDGRVQHTRVDDSLTDREIHMVLGYLATIPPAEGLDENKDEEGEPDDHE